MRSRMIALLVGALVSVMTPASLLVDQLYLASVLILFALYQLVVMIARFFGRDLCSPGVRRNPIATDCGQALRYLSVSSLFVFWLLAGYSAHSLLVQQYGSVLSAEQEGQVVRVSGSLCSDSKGTGQGGQSVQRVLFCVETGWMPGESHMPLPVKRLLLSCYYCDTPLLKGVYYDLRVRIKAKRPLQNFHDMFAWQRQWAYPWDARANVQEVLGQRLVAEARPVNQILANDIKSPFDATTFLQQAETLRHQASILALVLGRQQDLSDNEWRLLRNSGLTHLMVISGLHIGIVAGGLILVASALFRHLRKKHRQVVTGIAVSLGLILFLAVIETGLPVIRASTALLCGALIYLSRRRILLSTFWFMVMTISVLQSPFGMLANGFWLSFAGVGLLLLQFGNRMSLSEGWAVSLWRSQLAFFLGFSGCLLLIFAEVPLASVVANLVAVPLVCLVILPTGLLALVVAQISPDVSFWLLLLTDAFFQIFWLIPEWLLAIEPISLSKPALDMIGYSLLLSGGCLLVHFRFPMGLWVGVLLLLTWLYQPFNVYSGVAAVEVLDVAQGSAVLVQGTEGGFLYDAGPAYDNWSAGERIVNPRLKDLGQQSLEAIILSHGDSDHAGGYSALREHLSSADVYSGEPERTPGSEPCTAIPSFIANWDIQVLWPDARGNGFEEDSNNRSCVIRISMHGFSVLLTGDIDRSVQTQLIALKSDQLSSDVLVLPHHGSANSFHPGFLNAVSPSVAIASAGYRNSYGHPHALFADWLKARGVELLVTAREGAIRIERRNPRPARGPWRRQGSRAEWILTTAARPYAESGLNTAN